MSEGKLHTDVAVIGSGALGLWTAYELSQAGKHVTVLEKSPTLTAGASTRNVRTLRSGAHDLLRRDIGGEAWNEARRARAGFDRVSKFAPEAFLLGTDTYAPFFDDVRKEMILERWDAEGLPYKTVTPQQFKTENPEINARDIVFAATIPDACIDSRTVYQKLKTELEQQGVVFLANTELVEGNPINPTSHIRVGDEEYTLEANAYVVAAGYGAAEVYKSIMGDRADLRLRYGRAYVLGTPRATNNSILPIKRDSTDVSSHGDTSLFVKGSMTNPIEAPDFYVPEEKKLELIDAANELVPSLSPQKGDVHACITLNVSEVPGISEDGTTAQYGRYIFAWPGKMTNAPVIACGIAENLRDIVPSVDKGQSSITGTQEVTIAEYPTDIALKKLAASQ